MQFHHDRQIYVMFNFLVFK